MATYAGTGSSLQQDASAAVAEAAAAALARAPGDKPDLVVMFGSSAYDHRKLLAAAMARFPGSPVVGCSTAGEITDAGSFGASLCLMTLRSDALRFQVLVAKDLGRDAASVPRALADHAQQANAMLQAGFPHSTIMVLTDGLRGGGEELVKLVYDHAWVSSVVGGAAADDGRLERTTVSGGGEVLSDAAVMVRIFSRTKVGVGVQHGMRACTEPAQVTAAAGSVLQTIAGRPAFEYYEQYARSVGTPLTPANAGPFMLTHELAIYTGGTPKIRAPLSVNADGSLNMAAEVPRGSMVSIADGDPGSLRQAAGDAGEEARRNLGGKPAAVLLFECVCRKTILGQEFPAEARSIARCFDEGLPLLGFATYGEIARYGGKLNGFHNSTVVVCALPD